MTGTDWLFALALLGMAVWGFVEFVRYVIHRFDRRRHHRLTRWQRLALMHEGDRPAFPVLLCDERQRE